MFAPEPGGSVLSSRLTGHGDERTAEGEQDLAGCAGRLTCPREGTHVSRTVHLLNGK